MVELAVLCLVLLGGIGFWYYRQYLGAKGPPKKQGLDFQRLLQLDASHLTAVLADNMEEMEPSLLEETAALLTEHNLAPGVVSMLKSPAAAERVQAAEVLGYIVLPGGAESLVQALGDKSEAVRLAAASSLIRLGDAATAEPLAEALAHPGQLLPARVAEVLLALGDKAVMPLIDALGKAEQEGQPLICEVLGQLEDARALPDLMKVLKESPFAKSRAAAAQALGNIQGGEHLQALVDALKDSHWSVRAKAAGALGQLGSPEAEPALKAASGEDADWNVRVVAQAALKNLASQTEPPEVPGDKG